MSSTGTSSYKDEGKYNFKQVMEDPATALILFCREELDLHDIQSIENHLREERKEVKQRIKRDKSIKASGAEKWIRHYEEERPIYQNILDILNHRSSEMQFETSPEETAYREIMGEKLNKLDKRESRLHQNTNKEDISKFCDVYYELEDVYNEIVSIRE